MHKQNDLAALLNVFELQAPFKESHNSFGPIEFTESFNGIPYQINETFRLNDSADRCHLG